MLRFPPLPISAIESSSLLRYWPPAFDIQCAIAIAAAVQQRARIETPKKRLNPASHRIQPLTDNISAPALADLPKITAAYRAVVSSAGEMHPCSVS